MQDIGLLSDQQIVRRPDNLFNIMGTTPQDSNQQHIANYVSNNPICKSKVPNQNEKDLTNKIEKTTHWILFDAIL